MKLAEAGQVVDAIRLCVEERMKILISGGTSTGNTTFARSLVSMVDPDERILTIEDAYELSALATADRSQPSMPMQDGKPSTGWRPWPLPPGWAWGSRR